MMRTFLAGSFWACANLFVIWTWPDWPFWLQLAVALMAVNIAALGIWFMAAMDKAMAGVP